MIYSQNDHIKNLKEIGKMQQDEIDRSHKAFDDLITDILAKKK